MLPQLPREIWMMILRFKRKFHFNEIRATLHPQIERVYCEKIYTNFNFGESHVLHIRAHCHEFLIQTMQELNFTVKRITQYMHLLRQNGEIRKTRQVGSFRFKIKK